MSKRLRYLAIILFIPLITACHLTSEEIIPPIEYDDLIGEWTADYSQYDDSLALPNGKEKLVLNADGTFEQDFRTMSGHQSKVSGKWTAEETDIGWIRIYLNGAIYYLQGLRVAKDPTYGIAAWDDVTNQHVRITGGRGMVILYARRWLWKSQSLCGREHELILQHLPIGDLDAPEYVTFYRGCAEE